MSYYAFGELENVFNDKEHAQLLDGNLPNEIWVNELRSEQTHVTKNHIQLWNVRGTHDLKIKTLSHLDIKYFYCGVYSQKLFRFMPHHQHLLKESSHN